jgi:uridine phosphorylase
MAGELRPAPGDFYMDGRPRIGAKETLEMLSRRHGVTVDELRLEPVLVATFFPDLTDELVERSGAAPTVFADRRSPAGMVYRADGFCISTMPIGAPAAVMFAEQWLAAGVETLLIVGAAGSLQPRLPVGALMLPTEAIREEGTSHHYLPSEQPARAGDASLAALRTACAQRNVAALEGLHWTTDAPFREHLEKVEAYRDAGVLAVDMEVSALYAAAGHLGADCAALLVISDVLFEDSGWRAGFLASEYLEARSLAGEIAQAAAQALAVGAGS